MRDGPLVRKEGAEGQPSLILDEFYTPKRSEAMMLRGYRTNAGCE